MKEIIDDILDWLSEADQNNIEQHITDELDKLKRKTTKSSGFKERYQKRSGELPTTMLAKLEQSQQLIKKWREGDYSVGEYDKLVIADLLEFIVNPFRRFASSANQTLSNLTSFTNMLSESASTVAKTKKTLTSNEEAYDSLRPLLELCDHLHYTLPQNVRNGQPRHDYGIN